jgi:hypothetical protein
MLVDDVTQQQHFLLLRVGLSLTVRGHEPLKVAPLVSLLLVCMRVEVAFVVHPLASRLHELAAGCFK